jgi:S-adenosylmethionine/arginine decarboxylase-like enzyme
MATRALQAPAELPVPAAEPLFWGRWCGIDMHECDLAIISDRDAIARYIEEICDLLGFKRYGPSTIVRFGTRPDIAGFSFTQLIETSLVSGHLVDATRCVFIDIFSCATYSTAAAEAFTRRYFRAARSISHVIDRHGGQLHDARR